jgi:hypothetical protein
MEKSCKSASCEWHFLCIIVGGSTVGPVRFQEDIQNGRWSDTSCVTLLILIAYVFWFGGSLTVESSSLQSLVY